ncbi:hypothetical protein [Paenibacillus xylaniclasticus]|uniref:hypothetical protein n=1 Tax=Paenibacillus xylaniclasticus TaxID=588083 RepID=UPI000FDB2C35|nr:MULTISPECIES: hypothetical protein [Paenibacillus]GFN32425.1 hypothetical protein PCURB6_26850 [Paenibacillus curdlanolyticus]
MKYGQREVLEVMVFDEDGKLITNLNSLKNSGIHLTNHPFVLVKDALLDTNLLKFIGKVEDNKLSDYERMTGSPKYSTTITLGRKNNKKCRLIGKGYYREEHTNKDVEFMFEVPNATIRHDIELTQSNVEVAEYDILFRIEPFNNDGDVIKIHIQ